MGEEEYAEIIYAGNKLGNDVKYQKGYLLRIINMDKDPLSEFPGRYDVNKVTVKRGSAVVEETIYSTSNSCMSNDFTKAAVVSTFD